MFAFSQRLRLDEVVKVLVDQGFNYGELGMGLRRLQVLKDHHSIHIIPSTVLSLEQLTEWRTLLPLKW